MYPTYEHLHMTLCTIHLYLLSLDFKTVYLLEFGEKC